MTDQRIHIERAFTGLWEVHCPICDGELFPGVSWQAWARSSSWAVAVMLARWHVTEHQKVRCDHCGRDEKLGTPVPDPSERGLFMVGDDRYAVTAQGVRRVKLVAA